MKDISKKLSESVTPVVEAPHITKTAKELGKEKLKKYIEEETHTVRGIFQCFETPGSRVKIIVKKYPGIPHFEMEMEDGKEYEIPLYVARHLNGIDVTAEKLNGKIGSCSYPVHGFRMQGDQFASSGQDERGIPVPIVGVAKRVKRYGFQSLEFGAMV